MLQSPSTCDPRAHRTLQGTGGTWSSIVKIRLRGTRLCLLQRSSFPRQEQKTLELAATLTKATMQSISCSYAGLVRLRSVQNPCLGGLVSHMKHPPKVNCTLRLLEYNYDGTVLSNLAQFDQRELPQLFERPDQATGRILLIENLRPEVITCLGEQLDVDPMFFADYVTTDYQGIDEAPPPPSLAFCPSQIVERGHVHIHYQQVIDLGNTGYHKNQGYGLHTDQNVPRNIRRLPPLSERQLALSRACCSILVKRRGEMWYSKFLYAEQPSAHHFRISNNHITAIILTDPPVKEVFQEAKRGERKTYRAVTLHGGFEDFQPLATEEWDKSSMISSLLHYFRNHPPGFSISNPSTLCFAYYPLRIALAEWVLYVHLVSRYQKHYEYSLQDVHKRPLESDIVDLQRWRRRINQSRQKLGLLSQYITYWKKNEVDKQPWDMLLMDIDHTIYKLQHYGHSMEQVVPIATGMVQLLDARESAHQAANVTALTYIALVFVPLSWTAGLFSMSDLFLPGGEKFWVYISTAFPLAIVVLLVSVVPLRRVLMVVGSFLQGDQHLLYRRRARKNTEDGC